MIVRRRILTVLPVLAVAASAAGGVSAYHNHRASCGTAAVLDTLHTILRDQFHIDHIYINDAQAESGSWLTGSYVCTAQVAEIRNTNAADLAWRGVRYASSMPASGDKPVVSVALGDREALAPPPPRTLLQRLLPFLAPPDR
jgi:hypothetical protein